MIIRAATSKDIPQIKKIVDTLQVSRSDPDWQTKANGLFEYPKSEEELRASLNPYFLVAETSSGIRGYALAFDNLFFRKTYGETDHLEWRQLLDNFDCDFLYLDQLGALNPDSIGGARVANTLTDTCLGFAENNGLPIVVTYVCEQPHYNLRSQRYVRRKGFKRQRQIRIKDSIVLALYEKNL